MCADVDRASDTSDGTSEPTQHGSPRVPLHLNEWSQDAAFIEGGVCQMFRNARQRSALHRLAWGRLQH